MIGQHRFFVVSERELFEANALFGQELFDSIALFVLQVFQAPFHSGKIRWQLASLLEMRTHGHKLVFHLVKTLLESCKSSGYVHWLWSGSRRRGWKCLWFRPPAQHLNFRHYST